MKPVIRTLTLRLEVVVPEGISADTMAMLFAQKVGPYLPPTVKSEPVQLKIGPARPFDESQGVASGEMRAETINGRRIEEPELPSYDEDTIPERIRNRMRN